MPRSSTPNHSIKIVLKVLDNSFVCKPLKLIIVFIWTSIDYIRAETKENFVPLRYNSNDQGERNR